MLLDKQETGLVMPSLTLVPVGERCHGPRRLQVAEQRAAMPEEVIADDVAPWMSGDVEEEAVAEQRKGEENLDAETLHLLHTQRQYYDSVHVIKEKVRPCLPDLLSHVTLPCALPAGR